MKSKIIYELLLPLIKVTFLFFKYLKEEDGVSVSKLSAFIDWFNFMPYEVKKNKNNSKELFYIMTSNTKGEACY